MDVMDEEIPNKPSQIRNLQEAPETFPRHRTQTTAGRSSTTSNVCWYAASSLFVRCSSDSRRCAPDSGVWTGCEVLWSRYSTERSPGGSPDGYGGEVCSGSGILR